MGQVRDRPRPGEVEEILYGFRATLATLTTDDNLSEDEQAELDDLITGGDPLALSWLLTWPSPSPPNSPGSPTSSTTTPNSGTVPVRSATRA